LTQARYSSASTEQARALDGASARLGVSTDALMATAGFQCARLARMLLQEFDLEGPIAVLAGRGNNGGDALGCARHLAAWGTPVRAVTLAELDAPESLLWRQEKAATASGAELRRAIGSEEEALSWALQGVSLIVDGLLGTGSSGPLRGAIGEAVRQLSKSGARVMAIDVPSGLDATTGGAEGETVRADDTLMLAIPKSGCLSTGARALVGRMWLADIGVPALAYRETDLIPPQFASGGLQQYQ
jgi:hydroxyethylthiazole kinase-like uncharacterized protein yjeF